MKARTSLGAYALAYLTAACTVGAEYDPADNRHAPLGSGDGLAATYFDNMNLTAPKLERVDSTVNFSWGRGGPPGLGPNTFSVRWEGFVEATESATVNFHVTSDDGARLWVNGRKLIDQWNDHGPRMFSGRIALEAGERYPIKLEYYENGGGAQVKLEWSSANQPRELIPTAQLYSSEGPGGDASTVELAVDDAFVDSASPNTNFDTTALEIDGDPSTKFALIKPRGLSSIPPGSTVEQATLIVRNFDGGNAFTVHELQANWSETGVTSDNAPGIGPELESVSGNTGSKSIDVTAVVQAWVDGAPAHGIALYPGGTNGVDLYSSEHATAANRPRIVVTLAGGSDQCPGDPDKTSPGECGCGVPEGTCSSEITHVGTTEIWDSNGQNMVIDRPSGSRSGDLLVLVLHRTDDDLPLYVDGWKRVAECYKRDNGYECSTASDCTVWDNARFCQRFGDYGRGGHDLAQAVFVRKVGSNEPREYAFDLNIDSSGHPGWAILTALRGADTTNPVRDWSFKGCDGNADSLFPSVYAKRGDMILLSQSFDDAIAEAKFGAPTGTRSFGYVSNSDEAGFLFGGLATSTGDTGTMKTHGDGGPSCKDALVSMSIRPQ